MRRCPRRRSDPRWKPWSSFSLSAERLDDASAARAMRNRVRLEYRIETPAIVARRQDAELSLGQFSNVMRECCGRNWSPLEIQFEHPRPAEWRQHETAFGAPVFFGCPATRSSSTGNSGEADAGRDLKLLAMMRNCLEIVGSRPQRPSRCSTASAAPFASICRTARRHGGHLGELARTTASAVRRALLDEGLGLREAVDAMRFEMAQHYLAAAPSSIDRDRAAARILRAVGLHARLHALGRHIAAGVPQRVMRH